MIFYEGVRRIIKIDLTLMYIRIYVRGAEKAELKPISDFPGLAKELKSAFPGLIPELKRLCLRQVELHLSPKLMT